MEPHAEFLGHRIIDDLWTLQDAASLDVRVSCCSASPGITSIALSWCGLCHTQRHTAVAPVHQILRGVAHHTYHRIAGAVVLMFAKPIIGVFVFHDASTVGIDVASAVIVPQFTRTDGLFLLLLFIPILLQSFCLSLGDMNH